MPLRPTPAPLDSLVPHLTGARAVGVREVLVDHVTRDSRDLGPTSVFVAIPGTNVDGHAFVPSVHAAAAVVERDDVEPRAGVAKIVVPSTKRALAELAAALYGFPGRAMQVVGVTGTNGKTTTTTVIEEALRALGVRAGRIGTTGISIDGVLRPGSFTTPEAPQLQEVLAEMRAAGCAVVAMEVSSHGLAQHRVDGIPYAVGVFTNLTRDHLDFHGTMEAYRDAKARLFDELLRPPGGMPRALLFADDPAHTGMRAPSDRWTYGFAEGADLRIEEASLGLAGTRIRLRTPDGPVAIESPLVGRHNALNLVGAFGVLRCLGVAPDDAARAVGAVQGVPGRLERVPDPKGGRLVLVDYAHSDDALANVLPTVRELTKGRLWVVFGCGGDRDRGKRPKMGAVVAAHADVTVVTSDNPRSEDPRAIIDEILAGIPAGATVHVEVDRETAIRWALTRAERGDAALLAGKGHETYQEVHGVRRPFDDRAVARSVLEGG
jgi:UDP-N-acetylmuramoyl-L-alanyl-D-glutamate--2,6-diaminopimelate ligase